MKLTRKTSIFASILVAVIATSTIGYAAIPCQKRIKIVDHTLKLVDGTPQMKTRDMLTLINDINGLRTGTGLINYNGRSYNVEELAQKEHRETLQTLAAENALIAAIKHFQAISADYLNKARGHKTQMGHIIKAWATQRGITESILLEWSKQSVGQEHEEFKKLVKNFRTLDEFLEHLGCFLMDMSASCPKSFAIYKAERK